MVLWMLPALSQQYFIDVEVVLTPELADGQTQSSALGELFIEGADGFIISPEVSHEVNDSIRFAVEAGQKAVFESLQAPNSALIRVIADERRRSTGRRSHSIPTANTWANRSSYLKTTK